MIRTLYLRGAPALPVRILRDIAARLVGDLRCGAVLLVGLVAFASPAPAAELLMFRRVGCPYCETWDRSIGPVYPRSDLGRELPLRMVDLDADPRPAVALVRSVRYTPTFVLAEDGREIGRIEGFPGDAFFWGLLEKLARKLPPKS